MPVCKAEAHRALELLEDYYSRLDDTEEKELKAAIERVIKIFKSRLFQVKCNLQFSVGLFVCLDAFWRWKSVTPTEILPHVHGWNRL